MQIHARNLVTASFMAGALLASTAATVSADSALVSVVSDADVDTTVDRLTEAVENAGANVFAVIDHAAGAQSIGESLPPMTLVLLGNPEMGTPLLQESPSIGADLPVRVLIWEDDGGTVHIGYHHPHELADRHGIAADHPAIDGMTEALDALTQAAANEP